MDRHVEGKTLQRVAEEQRREDQMTRARDRQELGDSLYKCEYENLDGIQLNGAP
jgi:hypothetical protein